MFNDWSSDDECKVPPGATMETLSCNVKWCRAIAHGGGGALLLQGAVAWLSSETQQELQHASELGALGEREHGAHAAARLHEICPTLTAKQEVWPSNKNTEQIFSLWDAKKKHVYGLYKFLPCLKVPERSDPPQALATDTPGYRLANKKAS